MNKENTHILIDNDKIIVSPNLNSIFEFLIQIDSEVNTMLSFIDKQEKIRIQSMDIFDFVMFLAKKLEENNIEFQYNLKTDINKFSEHFGLHPPIRSQFIIIFAFFETIFSLSSAYNYETKDEIELRKITMNPDKSKEIIDALLLNNKNQYYKENKRLGKLSAKQLRNFRNTLTHFYSVGGGISISPSELEDQSRELESKIKTSFFLSPKELYQLISKGNRLLLQNWSDDYNNKPEIFEKKIMYVKSIVDNYGAKLIKWGDINIPK